MKNLGTWTWVGIIAVIVAIAVGIILWHVGWDVSNANNNRQTQQNQQGYSNQQGLHQQIDLYIGNMAKLNQGIVNAKLDGYPQEVGPLKQQRAQSGDQICSDATEITSAYPLSSYDEQWVKANCQGGSLSVHSPYYYTGG